jgi:hypothetical protein
LLEFARRAPPPAPPLPPAEPAKPAKPAKGKSGKDKGIVAAARAAAASTGPAPQNTMIQIGEEGRRVSVKAGDTVITVGK